MTTEEKAALVAWAHKWIEPAKRTVENNPQDNSVKASLALYEIALAALTTDPVAAPKGWKLVPVEPTEEMLTLVDIGPKTYKALLAAAPNP